MVLNATPAQLQKIQEIDREKQLEGQSFCDVWANYKGSNRKNRIANKSKIRRKYR
jgi:hypothetical protein